MRFCAFLIRLRFRVYLTSKTDDDPGSQAQVEEIKKGQTGEVKWVVKGTER